MKTIHLLSSALATLLLTGCGATSEDTITTTDDAINSTIDAATIIANATGVQTTSSYSVHNQGKNCAECHSSTSAYYAPLKSEDNDDDEYEYEDDDNEENDDAENVFDSGATVFATLNATDYDASLAAYGYSLRLVLQGSGEVVNYGAHNGTGNFDATFNAGIDKYTAQVLDSQGNIVNSSDTDSHDSSRFECNSCHTAGGENGAPGRIVAYDPSAIISTVTDVVDTTITATDTTTATTTTASLSFARDVDPILEANCASCHGSSGDFSITNNPPYTGTMQFVDTTNATNSLLLQKASGEVGHSGGTVLPSTSTEYITIRDWINQGALDN